MDKVNYEVYRICVYKAGDSEAILNDRIYVPENIEKYRIPHEIASYVELKLRKDMLTYEECQQAKQEEKAAYDKGLTDAWEAARKIVVYDSSRGLSADELEKIFGTPLCTRILRKFNASEAIAKIKAYEDGQKEIEVGDEVVENNDISKRIIKRGVVTYIKPTGSGNVYNVLWDDGRSCGYYKKEIKKTGRHFSQIEELLKAMKKRS